MTAFDIQKDKWFVRINSEEECKAVQEWAFAQGFHWFNGKVRKDYNSWSSDTGGKAIGFGHFSRSSLGQAPVSYWMQNDHHEIKLTFRTEMYVDEVQFPVVESAQQKRLRELEETIEAAQRQIAEIRKEEMT